MPGARLNNLLWIALCGFCFLKVFSRALEDENENGSLLVSSPRGKNWRPHCSVCPQGKVVSHSHLPGLPSYPVLTQPVTSCFHLRLLTLLRVSKHCRILCHANVLVLLREEGGSHSFCILLGLHLVSGFLSLWFMAAPS